MAASLMIGLFGIAILAQLKRPGHATPIVQISKRPNLRIAPDPSTSHGIAMQTHHAPEIVIQRINTDPTLIAQWAVPHNKIAIQRISDDQLLEELGTAHVSGGLERVDGKVKLLLPRACDTSFAAAISPADSR